jgi:DNA-binding LacI/PurR family transcriptional regulator
MNDMSVSQNDIAKAAGVSQRAVSFALNGKSNVSQEKREKILSVAQELGYRINASARAMRKQSCGAIGVLVQHYNVGNTFLQGINHTFQQEGFHTIIEQFTSVLPLSDTPCRVVLENVVDGLIVINSDATIIDLIQNQFTNLMDQTVWLESSYFAPFNCIRRDEIGVCDMAVKQVAAAGFRRVIYVGYLEHAIDSERLNTPFDKNKPYFGGIHFSSYQRYAGIKAACDKYGLEFVPVGSGVHDKPLTPDEFAAHLKQSSGAKSAVIPYDILMTQWVFRQLALVGMICPRDYGLLSLDDMRTFQQQQFWPELARVTFDRVRAGEMAAQMLLEMIQSKKQVKSINVTGDWVDGPTLDYD